jgi:hypothetical protein
MGAFDLVHMSAALRRDASGGLFLASLGLRGRLGPEARA